MNKTHYHFLLILMLTGLSAGLLYYLRSEALIAPGVFAGAMGMVSVVTLLALLGTQNAWRQPRHQAVPEHIQEERDVESRRYLEQHYCQDATSQVIQAAKELAQREGHLATYERRIASVKHQPLRLGDVWLALESSRVEAGVKTAMDDNALSRIARGRLDA